MPKTDTPKFVIVLFAVCLGWLLPGRVGVAQEKFSFDISTMEGTQINVPSQGFTVVCFLGIECPLSKLYGPRLNEMATEFRDAGFQFVAVNSNQQDSLSEWKAFVSDYLKFPAAKDKNNILANQLGVVRNPEVLVFDSDGNVCYRGRIDNQYMPGVKKLSVGRQDLRLALEQLRRGEKVEVPRTRPEGCLIGRVRKTKSDASVTYTQEVSRIFQRHCVECHRPGAIGPFSMTEYDEIVGWGDMIVETIDNQRMPPWHAAPGHGEFVNTRRLSDEEKQTVRTWVEEGYPYGDEAELPQPLQFVEKWRLPKEPDQVIAMSDTPFEVPADGTVDYHYFVVDPGFKEDKWISASEVIPGNRSVVHHSLVFVKPPSSQFSRGANLIGTFVPGQSLLRFDSQRAQRIPAGSKFVFQQHYTPNGSPQQDITRLGLVFVEPQDVQREMYTVAAINQDFEIGPHEEDVMIKEELEALPSGAKLLSIAPHMHFRGKSFTATVKRNDGTSEVVLSVPNYDFNWQHIYEFKQPLDLDDVASIEMEVHFDNSENNPFNPDPEKYVVWGDQSWEEMAVGFFNISRPITPSRRKQFVQTPSDPVVKTESGRASKKGKQFARALIEKNDANGDGALEKSEMPIATRAMFYEYDLDGNGKATDEEISRAATRRYNQRNDK